jgi:aspartyl-tRNA synthetase
MVVGVRDHAGNVQAVCPCEGPIFGQLQRLALESVITITGTVAGRSAETVDPHILGAEIEIRIDVLDVQAVADPLPLSVDADEPGLDDVHSRYRFIELRRKRAHDLVQLRSRVVSRLRHKLVEHGFVEVSTPLLTAPARKAVGDFLVPSRLHRGKFYALAQEPRLFRQLLMLAGFDRYFQVAPCFRDESARTDRTPGEFQQLDVEMSFVRQEDVFSAIEPILFEIFNEHGKRSISPMTWPRIDHAEAMLKYGSDKPDLRIPIEIKDVTDILACCDMEPIATALRRGLSIRAVPLPGASSRPRCFLEELDKWALDNRIDPLSFVWFYPAAAVRSTTVPLGDSHASRLREVCGLGVGDAVCLVCAEPAGAASRAGAVRTKLADMLDLREKDSFRMCWVVHFPMFERGDGRNEYEFAHDPLAMPIGGLDALNAQHPLDVGTLRYALVCNGMDIGAGAIRNDCPAAILKAFEIAGYSTDDAERALGGLLRALEFGAPPHGGAAISIDRLVMQIADLANARESVPFALTARLEDVMLGAPGAARRNQLDELGLRLVPVP